MCICMASEIDAEVCGEVCDWCVLMRNEPWEEEVTLDDVTAR